MINYLQYNCKLYANGRTVTVTELVIKREKNNLVCTFWWPGARIL